MESNNFYMGGMIDFQDDVNILRKNKEYGCMESKSVSFIYDYTDDRLKELEQKYELRLAAGTGDEFIQMLKITYKIAQILNPGPSPQIPSFHALEILEKSQDGFRSNCFLCATVLTECFLAMGYAARMVRCMPIDLRFQECHCVVAALVKKYNKFIVFDPAMGGCYLDEAGVPMGLHELRNAYLENRNYRIRSIFKLDQERIKKYFVKNLVRFQSYQTSRYGNEIKGTFKTMINLNPISMPMSDKLHLSEEGSTDQVFTYDANQFWSIDNIVKVVS